MLDVSQMGAWVFSLQLHSKVPEIMGLALFDFFYLALGLGMQ